MKDQGQQEARIVLLMVQRTLPLFREQGEGDACQGIKKKYYEAMYIPMNGLLQAYRQFEFRLCHFPP